MARRPVILFLLLAAACSPQDVAGPNVANAEDNAGAAQGTIDVERYRGKRLSAFLSDHSSYLIRHQAVSPEALKLFSESDGIEIPGKVYRAGDRAIIVFSTCAKGKCSSAYNVVAVDPVNEAMHVVNTTKGKNTVVVDGPPDVAAIVAERCKAATCA